MAKHQELSGDQLHAPGYVQSSDPGAVGPLKLWIDTTDPAAPLYKIRKPDDSGWDDFTPVSSGGALSSLSDVTLTSPSNGQVLTYDSGTGKWKNAAGGGGGGGGGGAKEPYDPPASPNADDEEFEGGSLSGWTHNVTPGSGYTEKFAWGGSWFALHNNGSGTGTNASEWYKAFTRAGAFSMTMRTSLSNKGSNYAAATIGFREGRGGSDKIFQFSHAYNGQEMVRTDRYDGSSWNYGERTHNIQSNASSTMWIHVKRDGSNNWSFFYSFDGVTWVRENSTVGQTMTIAEVFVSITHSTTSGGASISSAIDFVRFDWLTL